MNTAIIYKINSIDISGGGNTTYFTLDKPDWEDSWLSTHDDGQEYALPEGFSVVEDRGHLCIKQGENFCGLFTDEERPILQIKDKRMPLQLASQDQVLSA